MASGLDGAGEALPILVNEASRMERAQHLQASPYEPSAARVDYANGFKLKTMLTRLGELTFEVPQVSDGGIYPSALERGSRSEQSVNLALAEMYVQGRVHTTVTDLSTLLGGEKRERLIRERASTMLGSDGALDGLRRLLEQFTKGLLA